MRDCIIIYYQIMPEEYRYPDTWGWSLVNGYVRAYANKESYNFTYEETSFACIDLETSKLVWWDLDGITLGMACPPNRTDDEIAAIALSVERIETE